MAEPARLYALVDLAAAPELLPLVEGLAQAGAARCLFEGALAPALLRVSPFIVDTARAPGLLDRWRAEGAGKPWGVLMETPLPMHLARRHVRRFLQVRLPDGSGPVLCRFWDPRVLGPLLDHADAAQRRALFAQPVAWRLVGEDGQWWRVDVAGLRRAGAYGADVARGERAA